MKLRKGDHIIVTAGKDKGRKGKIERVYPAAHAVLVPGLNMFKRHQKRRDERHEGGIIEYNRPLLMGNIALLCPKCGKPTRVGYFVSKGQKERICKKCGSTI